MEPVFVLLLTMLENIPRREEILSYPTMKCNLFCLVALKFIKADIRDVYR